MGTSSRVSLYLVEVVLLLFDIVGDGDYLMSREVAVCGFDQFDGGT